MRLVFLHSNRVGSGERPQRQTYSAIPSVKKSLSLAGTPRASMRIACNLGL